MENLNVLEMQKRIMEKRRAGFYGRCYWYNSANEGRQVIGLRQDLAAGHWVVAYVNESCARRAVRSSRLPAGDYPAALQLKLDVWAGERELEEVI